MIKYISSVLFLIMFSGVAFAHSWYPADCCSDNDCAPILSKEMKELNGTMVLHVTTKHGTAPVFPLTTKLRQSEDDKEHACLVPNHEYDGPRFDYNGSTNPSFTVICLFTHLR